MHSRLNLPLTLDDPPSPLCRSRVTDRSSPKVSPLSRGSAAISFEFATSPSDFSHLPSASSCRRVRNGVAYLRSARTNTTSIGVPMRIAMSTRGWKKRHRIFARFVPPSDAINATSRTQHHRASMPTRLRACIACWPAMNFQRESSLSSMPMDTFPPQRRS